jgi:hypothetical protein
VRDFLGGRSTFGHAHVGGGVSMLKHVAHQIMTHELGVNRTSGELALAGVGVYAKLLAHLSPYWVRGGSQALFRSSLRLSTFPFLKEIRAQDPQALQEALNTSG